MQQLAILEGENLGASGIRKLARQTKNVAKKTGSVTMTVARTAAKPVTEVTKLVKRQILEKAKGLINRQVGKFVTKLIPADKLVKTGTAALAASVQPAIQTPIISALALIPGAQPLIPVAPTLISAATYKIIDDLKKAALKKTLRKTKLAGESTQDKTGITAAVAAVVLVFAINKRRGK